MSGQHTPGPWHVEAAYLTIDSPATVIVDRSGMQIAVPTWTGDESSTHCTTDPDVLRANSHLIAAAPDMHEALQAIVTARSLKAARALALAALAKTTNRSAS